MKKFLIGFGAATVFVCLTAAASFTNPSQIWFTTFNGVQRLLSDKLADHLSVYDFGGKCDGSADDHVAMQLCMNNAWDCEFPGLAAGLSCNAKGNTLVLPTRHTISGPNMRAAVLQHTGTGCQITVDNNDGWALYHLTLLTTGVTTGSKGLCVTNVSGPTLRGSVEDVAVISDAVITTFAVTGSISATTFTVTIAGSGSIVVGDQVTGVGVTAGTTVTAFGTGTGGTGTYTVSATQTVGSESLTVVVPPTPGTYGVDVEASTLNSNYYADFRHLVTIGWDRGVELHGALLSGGANANFFSAYSGNANTTGIFFDGLSSDNWVQGHCNGSGQVSLAQNCVALGDGVSNANGNFVMGVTSDTGPLGTAFKLPSPSAQNTIIAENESGATDLFTSDSTNYMMVNKQVGNAGRSFWAHDTFFSGIGSYASDLFIGSSTGGALRTPTTVTKTNVDYTLTAHDRNICTGGLTAPHTMTLAPSSGQNVVIADCDGTIAGSNTITIAPPATGRVNSSTSGIVLNVGWKSAQCSAPTTTGLFWSCTVTP